jgi:ATP-dependent NAD(P)H-hydrate dehydratase
MKVLDVGGIIVKGETDTIVTKDETVTCCVNSGLKRCGGLGDVLAGIVCVFTTWFRLFERSVTGNSTETTPPIQLHQVLYAACAVARESQRRAYVGKGRSMGAEDVLSELEGVVDDLWPPF